jgi:hypothetical protein
VAEANIASASLDFLVGVAVGAASCGAVTAVVSASENRKVRRMRDGVEDIDDTAVGLQDVTDQGTHRASALKDSGQQASFDEQVPAVDEAGVVDGSQAEHEATDYEDIADNYVHRLTWKERMGSRARGVKELLEERMSKDMFSDLPVIERADGSVGDIGTGWWSATLGDSIRQDDSIAPDAGTDDIDMTGEHGPLDVFESSINAAVASASSEVSSPDVELNTQRGSYIAQRIAEVEQQGSFSEKSDSATPNQDELWELSMAQMDAHREEVLSAEAAEEAAVKKASESPTAVLPFRPPAGHPEVVDTDTYVDYLIRQEFERSSSQAVRTKSRDYLRVMEGGSQSEPTVFTIRGKHEPHHAKHMAPMRQAPEHLWVNEA